MKTFTGERFWVSFTGVLIEDDCTPIELQADHNQILLREVTGALAEDPRTDQPAVYATGDGRITISGIVTASSRLAAIDVARIVFTDCVVAGGVTACDLDQVAAAEGFERWRAHAVNSLLGESAEAQVVPLAAKVA